METIENIYLFLVVLGGRADKANVELHDVRWVIGSKIEDTFKSLRRDWFGSPDGLHIDSYKKIKHVDGYKIKLKNFDNKKILKNKFVDEKKNNKNLWFINLGGYDSRSMQEKHEFGLVVASTSTEAKNIAKSKWLTGCKKKHNDDTSKLKIFCEVDDYQVIKKIDNWIIELIPDENHNEENNFPNWFGYMRIDKN